MARVTSKTMSCKGVKDERGTVSLTEKQTAMLRWMVAGHEMDPLVTEFVSG